MKHKHSFIHLNLTWHPLILQTYGELRSGQVNVTKPKFIFSRIFLSNYTAAVLLAKEFNLRVSSTENMTISRKLLLQTLPKRKLMCGAKSTGAYGCINCSRASFDIRSMHNR